MTAGLPAALAVVHPVAQVGWTDWTIHWSTVVGLAALGVMYEWGARRVHARARAAGTEAPVLRPGQRVAFYSALFIIFASLNGPLHDLSDYYLFSAHMVQHLLLSLAMPPLMLVGTPGWLLRPLIENPYIGAFARAVTPPIRCFIIFNVVIALWHLPPLYNTAMEHHSVHIVQHLTFMTASVIMWWPFLSPLPELPRLAYPGQMLYCFLMVIPMSIVAIYIAMADHVLYPAYSIAPRLWGISPLSDQQIGGLIMWVPGGLLFYVVMTVVFFKWAREAEDDEEKGQGPWAPGQWGGKATAE